MLSDFLVYFLPFVLSFLMALLLTPLVRRLSLNWGIVDSPNQPRKIQSAPIPLLGGLAIYSTFILILLISWVLGWLADGIIQSSQILAIILGGFIIVLIGFWDDKYNLRTKSFIGPLLAASLAVILGITIKYVTNPFLPGSGPYDRALFYFTPYLGAVVSFFWLLGIMYTTKLLDGLDGLVTGIGAIGALILFIVSLFWDVPHSGTSILALILCGACLGFLIYNWHPAKIFLGESGSVFIGFMLGILSIISGAKIATTLMIIGIPLLDVIWIILRRIFYEHKSPFIADRKHLHFRLLDIGFSHRAAVLFLYSITLIFGVSSLFLQSQSKVIAFGLLVLVMIILAVSLVLVYKKRNSIQSSVSPGRPGNKKIISLLILFLCFNLFLLNGCLPDSSSTNYFKTILINHHPLRVEIADSPQKRAQGLSGRPYLPPDQGMLFVFDNYLVPTFWMKDMYFPLDIIWIKDDLIVDITRHIPPPDSAQLETYSPSQPVNFVLEVNAGWVDDKNIQIGQTFTFK